MYFFSTKSKMSSVIVLPQGCVLCPLHSCRFMFLIPFFWSARPMSLERFFPQLFSCSAKVLLSQGSEKQLVSSTLKVRHFPYIFYQLILTVFPAYAEQKEVEASTDALKFNCAQRAHQNTLESIPIVYATYASTVCCTITAPNLLIFVLEHLLLRWCSRGLLLRLVSLGL